MTEKFTSNCTMAPNQNANFEGTSINFFHVPKVDTNRSKKSNIQNQKTSKTLSKVASHILKM